MSRLQLALNVADLDEAIEFYTKAFGVGPRKVQPGYANFAIDEPPLKLVLFAGGGAPGTINHLGVEVMSTDEVATAATRLASAGLTTRLEERTDCCYAVQDKVWTKSPEGHDWEWYVVLEDTQPNAVTPQVAEAAAGCCGVAAAEPVTLATR